MARAGRIHAWPNTNRCLEWRGRPRGSNPERSHQTGRDRGGRRPIQERRWRPKGHAKSPDSKQLDRGHVPSSLSLLAGRGRYRTVQYSPLCARSLLQCVTVAVFFKPFRAEKLKSTLLSSSQAAGENKDLITRQLYVMHHWPAAVSSSRSSEAGETMPHTQCTVQYSLTTPEMSIQSRSGQRH